MPTYLDDKPLDVQAETLADLLDEARKHLADTGRIVVEVHVEGEMLDDQTLDEQMNEPIGDRDMRLVSVHSKALVSVTLSEVRVVLGEARELQDEAAELLQHDQGVDAMVKIAAALEVWQQAQQAVLHTIGLMGIDFDQFTVDDLTAPTIVNRLVDQLKSLREAVEAGDGIALADALAYEWPQMTDQWDRLLERLIETVEQDAG